MPELQTVLITGASEGIGRCFAEVFAKRGHDLVLVARNQSRLNDLAAALSAEYSIDAQTFAADLIPRDAPQQLFEQLDQQQIEVDILVNNAGMMVVEKFDSSDADALNNLLQLNIQSLVNMTHQFVRPMLARGRGKILNVGSVASFMPTPTFSVYGASKAFVLSFSEGISEELKGTGVTVTCVCPGFTDTNMLSDAKGLEKRIPRFLKADPAKLAEEAYVACMKGDVVFVDSLANKALVQFATHYPRRLVRGINGLLVRLG